MKILKTTNYKQAQRFNKQKPTENAIIEVNGDMLSVKFYYTKGSSGSFYRNNGDPGDAPEEPDVDIISITDVKTGQIIPDGIFDSKYDIIEVMDKCIEQMEQNKMNNEVDYDDMTNRWNEGNPR